VRVRVHLLRELALVDEVGSTTVSCARVCVHTLETSLDLICVQVFRKVYEEVGLGWVYAVTRVPILGQLADSAYDLWARHRLQITGRRDLAEVLKERQQKAEALRNAQCTDECEVKW
jgi:predicted DCC family thiol-disulfide oxidoreductase YuxK